MCEIQEIIIAINGINTKYEDIKSKLEKINEKIVALENEELEKKDLRIIFLLIFFNDIKEDA